MARGAMGEDNRDRAREVAALRLGIELGLSLIDTGEMYGDAQPRKSSAKQSNGNSKASS